MLLLALSVTIALAVSFLCSLAEAVLLSVNPMRLASNGEPRERQMRLWLGLKRNVERPITAILVLNTVAHTGGALLAGSAFEQTFGGQWLWAFSLTFLLGVLFGTEIVPKVLGVRFNSRLAQWIGPALVFSIRCLSPVIAVTERATRLLAPRNREDASDGGANEAEDIVMLARAAAAENLIHSLEELIIIHAATLSARRVRTLMTPRDRVRVLPRTFLEQTPTVAPARHEWLLVSDDGRDDSVNGAVRDFRTGASRGEIEPIATVHPRQSLTEALQRMLEMRAPLARVVDSSDRLVGVLFRDDIARVLLGDGDPLPGPDDRAARRGASETRTES